MICIMLFNLHLTAAEVRLHKEKVRTANKEKDHLEAKLRDSEAEASCLQTDAQEATQKVRIQQSF